MNFARLITLSFSFLLVAGCMAEISPTPEAVVSWQPTIHPTQAISQGAKPLVEEATALTATATLFQQTVQTGIPRYSADHTPLITLISMINSLQGWGISGTADADKHLLRTEDGGSAWYDVTPPEEPGMSQEPKEVLAFFLNPQQAWAVYKTSPHAVRQDETLHVWFTDDGGLSWSRSQAIDLSTWQGRMAEPRYLEFVNSLTGWLAIGHDPGAGQAPMSIFQTIDGGHSWMLMRSALDQPNGNLDTCCQSGMAYLSDQVGLVTNLYGPITSPFIDWTIDGGKTWQTIQLPLPEAQLAESGLCGTTSPIALPPLTVQLVMQCLDADSQTGASLTYLYTTTDGGINWTYHQLPDPSSQGEIRTSIQRKVEIQFFDPNTGWAIVHDHYQAEIDGATQTITSFFSTHDGGNNWEEHTSSSWSGQLSFIDLQSGWAVIDNPSSDQYSILYTQHSAEYWQELQPRIIQQ